MNKNKSIIVINNVGEINNLHKEISGQLKNIMVKVFKVGELLIKEKKKTKHGDWLQWIEDNLTFSQPTAYWYMKCYKNKSKLLTVNNLRSAMRLLAPSKIKLEKREMYIKDIEPNPFWDGDLCIRTIKHYYNSFKELGVYHTFVVRLKNEKYQLLYQNSEIQAVKMFGIDKVMVSIIKKDFTDKQMKDVMEWEMITERSLKLLEEDELMLEI